jgi:GT2 family glycosyltransferase
VVDDGSTDDTERVVAEARARLGRKVTYVRQVNAGAYGARNTALDHATGDYVAFYDSDDLWLPNHLADCVRVLDLAPDVVWAYAACRIVDHETGKLLDDNTFVTAGKPRPFRTLATRDVGAFHVFADERTVEMAFAHGLYCGLQNSVIRRSVFASERFHTAFRNEAEDQLFAIRVLKRGLAIGYLDAVHVEYRVHQSNSSGSATGASLERQLNVYRPVVRGFEELRGEFAWSAPERRALARRIATEHFWHIGYALLWSAGRHHEALEAFRAGLRAWPWNLGTWKTYAAARLRVATGLAPAGKPS